MKKAIVLFTGINFSHYMADYSVKWAAKNEVPLLALFLRASREKEEGYFFPSDLDAAENITDRRDAERDDLLLINDYQKLMKDLGIEMNVPVSISVLSDPSDKDLLSLTKEASIVFVDATYDSTDILSPKGFTLEEFQKKSNALVEVIREP